MGFRRLAANATLLQFINLGLPLLFTLALVKLYSIADFGIYSTLFSIIAIIAAIAEYGLQAHGMATIQHLISPADKKKLLIDITQTKILVSALSLPLYIGASWYLMRDRLSLLGIGIGYIYIIGVALNSAWFFYGENKLSQLIASNTVIRLTTLGLLVILGLHTPHIDFAIALNAVAFFVVGITSTAMALRLAGGTMHSLLRSRPDMKAIISHLRSAAPLSLTSVFVVFYTSINVILVSHIMGPIAAGIIGIAERVVRAGQTILSGITTSALASAATRSHHQNQRVLAFQIVVFVVAGFLIWPAAPIIFSILTQEAGDVGVHVLRIYAAVFILGSISSALNTHYFIRTKKYKLQTVVVFTGCLVNIPLMVGLATTRGLEGAAWAVVLTEGTVLLFTLLLIRTARQSCRD